MNKLNNFKEKKPFLMTGSGILLLFVFFLARYMTEDFHNRKAYDKVKGAMPNMERNINKLSPEEYNQLQGLRDKVFEIIYKHLEDYEKEKFIRLINNGMQMPADLEEFNTLFNKVKYKLSQEDKVIINEFEKLTRDLLGIGK